jgi:glycosyltransferase involved in cell wall biosynthesis
MPQEATPEVTILVPALNEEDTIRELLERLLALEIESQIIVIDDGSTDKTPKILEEYKDRIMVLRNNKPGGKGAAIVQGLDFATGKAVVIQDADLEYRPEELPDLVRPILTGDKNVVYGTRFSRGMPSGMALPNKVVNVLLVWTVRLLFGRKLTDEATCYKAFRRELLQDMNLACQRFEFCPEVTAKAVRLGEQIYEVPISYEPRTKLAGKKIRWQDAPEAFWTLLKHRFSQGWQPRDRRDA